MKLGLLWAVGGGLAACSGGGDPKPSGPTSSTAANAVQTRDVTTVGYVKSDQLGAARREPMRKQVCGEVDEFLDHTYLGSHPSQVTICVLQGGTGDSGGPSVVPFTDQAGQLGDEARDDATLETCPGS